MWCVAAVDSGTWDVGTTVRFGYYAQTGLQFEAGKKVIDIVRDIAEVVDLGNGQKMTASQFLSRGTTARSVSLSWGARAVGSPCEWRGGARHCSGAMVGESGLETC